jgi:hypothetical protein
MDYIAQMNIIERNNVLVRGSGNETIFFAHGFGCDSNMWRLVTPAFQDRYLTAVFDHVGSGKSDLKAYSSRGIGAYDGLGFACPRSRHPEPESPRGWRKLHLAVDADSGEIIAHSLTDQETGNASQLEPLLDQIDDEIDQFTADGAYDGYPTYDAVLRHTAGARAVIPPRSNAVEWPNAHACCQRDDHIASMQAAGRLKWQASTGYGKRALVETAMGRYKRVIGPRLRARSFLAQQTEAAIDVAILNRMLACGRPKSVRCKASTGATK